MEHKNIIGDQQCGDTISPLDYPHKNKIIPFSKDIDSYDSFMFTIPKHRFAVEKSN